jgi:hypothetical protein
VQYQVEQITRDFKAGEAAEISGVSQALQRDWRRRGFLGDVGETGRVRFPLSDVVHLKVMKMLSDGGIGVKGASVLASHASAAVLAALETMPEAIGFDGADLRSDEVPGFLEQIGRTHWKAMFMFFPLPEPNGTGPLSDGYFLISPAQIQEIVEKDGPWSYGLLFNLRTIALEMVQKARGPLVTYRLTEGHDE